jgi:hypothetical protein
VGASVTDAMGRQAPEGLLGIHMNLLVTTLGGATPAAETEQERAAIIMVAVFSVFATTHEIELKMLGIGLPAAVLIDVPQGCVSG